MHWKVPFHRAQGVRVTPGPALPGRFSLVLGLLCLLYQGNPIDPIHGVSYARKDLTVLTRLPLVPDGADQERLSAPFNSFLDCATFHLLKPLPVL